MKPDRSNYEVWFIDWLDGKLNEIQENELKLFLEENPDLAEELDGLSRLELKPDNKSFHGKNRLLRSTENYSESQFEYLCVAYLENDLNADQSAELIEIINRDAEKKKTFDLICSLRLKPENVNFPRKSSVKRLTIPARVLRISAITVSVAATAAILIAGYFLLKPQTGSVSNLTASGYVKDTLIILSAPVLRPEDHFSVVTPERKIHKGANAIFPGASAVNSVADNVPAVNQLLPVSDSVRDRKVAVNPRIEFSNDLRLSSWSQPNTIAPYNPGIMPPTYDPYGRRSNVDRFIARIFHERIMKDRSAGDRPVGSFELAEAGIIGLNKLLGWAMVLQENPENVRDQKSYRFTSRLVKINTPVRKISDIM